MTRKVVNTLIKVCLWGLIIAGTLFLLSVDSQHHQHINQKEIV